MNILFCDKFLVWKVDINIGCCVVNLCFMHKWSKLQTSQSWVNYLYKTRPCKYYFTLEYDCLKY